ncbi:MAG TPA: BTAD domain-containing putative transcriptional regulator [Jiangellaceae bacterium]
MRIGILGPLDVRTDTGDPIELSGARLRALLTVLALGTGSVQTQRKLIDSLWPDNPPAGGVNALQALVSRLRRALPEGTVESNGAGYRLALAPESVDAHLFEQLIAAGRNALAGDPRHAADAFRRALALWRGPALPDVADSGVALPAVARLDELRVSAIEDLVDAQLRGRNGPPDISGLHAVVAEHPTRERAAHLLMQALVAAGRPADALAEYDRLRTTLAERLGIDPSRELADLHLRILRGAAEPPPSVASAATNLRAGVTSFIGRDDDIVRVGKLVSESRLVTLTGPGGSGKTRLAVEAARSLLHQLPDGAWLVELAALGSASALPQAILTTLGLHEQAIVPRTRSRIPATSWATLLDQLADHLGTSTDVLDRLTGALADKDMLLVLDNCEHLVEAVAAIADHLLGRCPRLRILTTSREPLGVTGEALRPVEPLDVPSEGASAAIAAAYPAVRLFVDRAAAAYPEFSLDDETVQDVLAICRALDGMPLAIELAAARLRTMTLNQIACRLDDRFGLLTAGSRTALPRHQTLRRVVDWSWDLLTDDERTLLRRLAYFSGGATPEAAERVMTAAGHPHHDVLDLLTALVDKSLLVLDRDGGARYRLLETIKAYGLERLAEAGETDLVHRAHTEYFLDLAEAAEPHLRTADQLNWLQRLDAEYENIHAALRGAINAGDAATAVRFVGALGAYWNLRGKRVDGLALSNAAVSLPGETPEIARALAYANGGLCAYASYWPLDDERAEAWFETSVQLAGQVDQRQHPMLRLVLPMASMAKAWKDGTSWTVPDALLADPDPWVRGTALIMRAYSGFYSGADHDQGASDLRRSLDEFRSTGDRSVIAMALGAIAEVESWRGEFDAAAAHSREALALVAELSSVEEMALQRVFLGRQLWLTGEHDRARAELRQAVQEADRSGIVENRIAARVVTAEIARLSGDCGTARDELHRAARFAADLRPDSEHHGSFATALGLVAAADGQIEAAREHHRNALERTSPSADPWAISRTLIGIADLAMADQRPAAAAELLGATAAVRGFPDSSAIDANRVEAAARTALGETRFAEAYERGRLAATREQACELARVTLSA